MAEAGTTRGGGGGATLLPTAHTSHPLPLRGAYSFPDRRTAGAGGGWRHGPRPRPTREADGVAAGQDPDLVRRLQLVEQLDRRDHPGLLRRVRARRDEDRRLLAACARAARSFRRTSVPFCTGDCDVGESRPRGPSRDASAARVYRRRRRAPPPAASRPPCARARVVCGRGRAVPRGAPRTCQTAARGAAAAHASQGAHRRPETAGGGRRGRRHSRHHGRRRGRRPGGQRACRASCAALEATAARLGCPFGRSSGDQRGFPGPPGGLRTTYRGFMPKPQQVNLWVRVRGTPFPHILVHTYYRTRPASPKCTHAAADPGSACPRAGSPKYPLFFLIFHQPKGCFPPDRQKVPEFTL
jgi:hypothetical protein